MQQVALAQWAHDIRNALSTVALYVETLEHPADRLGEHLGQRSAAGCRIDRAKRAEEAAVGAQDRHRDIALEAVHRRRVVSPPVGIGADMIDEDGAPARTDFVADRRLDDELVARLQPELDPVDQLARDPAPASNKTLPTPCSSPSS